MPSGTFPDRLEPQSKARYIDDFGLGLDEPMSILGNRVDVTGVPVCDGCILMMHGLCIRKGRQKLVLGPIVLPWPDPGVADMGPYGPEPISAI